MRAGIVPTVVGVIMNNSGPGEDPKAFNNTLDAIRPAVDSINSQIVMLICRAFPAYKPEDIYKMPWEDVVLRVVQAERILLYGNPPQIQEPIRLLTGDELEKKTKKKPGKINVEELIADGKKMAGEMGGRMANEQGTTEESRRDYFQDKSEIAAKRRQVEKKYRGR
jgi:hypothetical protein